MGGGFVQEKEKGIKLMKSEKKNVSFILIFKRFINN